MVASLLVSLQAASSAFLHQSRRGMNYKMRARLLIVIGTCHHVHGISLTRRAIAGAAAAATPISCSGVGTVPNVLATTVATLSSGSGPRSDSCRVMTDTASAVSIGIGKQDKRPLGQFRV